MDPYSLAQSAMADLKAAVRLTLEHGPPAGLPNAQIGRMLGIYAGHIGHEGHISRTILAMLESEGVIEQLPETKSWRLRNHTSTEPDLRER
jgi:hypothetical protein